ncbi:MAG: YcjX family protein [Pseudomonadota bacterium]
MHDRITEDARHGHTAPPASATWMLSGAGGPLSRIGALADDMLDGIERLRSEAGAAFEGGLRVGVTGLSGAGKTVFITALAASLLERDRLRRFAPAAEGRILAALLRPQPDDDVPRFPVEANLARLRGDPPTWPEATGAVSQLRVALRMENRALLERLARPLFGDIAGPQTVNVDIVDYPGEWLMDLALIDADYEGWSAGALASADQAVRREAAAGWHGALPAARPGEAHDEAAAGRLGAAWAAYLQACRKAGFSTLAPGRFLMPGEYAGSPMLAFAPLPRPESAAERAPGTLWGTMRARFETYKRAVAKPFFRKHFAKLDRQVVLVDALSALARGPGALADMTEAMGETLACFRHGRSSWLDRVLGARRIDRVLVAATKADRLHHGQHARLTALIEAMTAEAARRARFDGAETRAIALAAVRATAEDTVQGPAGPMDVVRGETADGRRVAVHAGRLPEDAGTLIHGGGVAAPDDFAAVDFRPPRWGTGGPPHIRLDAALDWLIGDRLG